MSLFICILITLSAIPLHNIQADGVYITLTFIYVGLSKHEALIIRSIRVFDSTGTTRMVISEAFYLEERFRFQQYFSYIEAVSFNG